MPKINVATGKSMNKNKATLLENEVGVVSGDGSFIN
jgi:hypothetical protein